MGIVRGAWKGSGGLVSPEKVYYFHIPPHPDRFHWDLKAFREGGSYEALKGDLLKGIAGDVGKGGVPGRKRRGLSIQTRISLIFEFFKSSRKKTQLFMRVLNITDSWSILSQIPATSFPLGNRIWYLCPIRIFIMLMLLRKLICPGSLKSFRNWQKRAWIWNSLSNTLYDQPLCIRLADPSGRESFPGSLLSQISYYSHIPHPPTPTDAIEIVILSEKGDRIRPKY